MPDHGCGLLDWHARPRSAVETCDEYGVKYGNQPHIRRLGPDMAAVKTAGFTYQVRTLDLSPQRE